MIQLLLPVFMIAASVGMYFGYIDTAYKDAQGLLTQKQEFDAALNNANKLADKRDQLEEKEKSFSADDKLRLSRMVPDYADNVQLIMEVDRIALKYGMSLREVRVSGASSALAAETPGSIGGSDKEYNEVVLSFSVSSKYPVFKQFLSELENNLRITDVENIEFSASQGPTAAADIYQFKVTLKTYSLK